MIVETYSFEVILHHLNNGENAHKKLDCRSFCPYFVVNAASRH